MVNIFIPTYNGEQYLPETLDSVLAQSYRSWELYCVDDTSSDGSYSLLQEYASNDARIKVFRKSHGGDVPHAWQFIIPHLSGEFTLYMSQDDLLKPDTLQRLIARQEETDADTVIPSLTWYYGVEQPTKTDRGVKGDLSPILSGKDAFELMMDYSIPGFALWRTDIIRKNPVPLVAFNSDEYAQRLWCSRCHTVAFSDGEFLYRQDNPAAITQQFATRQIESPITDAMVLDRAVELNVAPDTITRYANSKYKDLWFYATWLLLHKDLYSRTRRRQLRRNFSCAWHSLHPHITLTKWKYRYSKHSIILFQLLVRLVILRVTITDCLLAMRTRFRLAVNAILIAKLRLHKLLHSIHHPIVHYYAVCWNEEYMLPFMFQHYQQFVDKFIIYDNHSTDNSVNLIRSRNDAHVIEFDSDGFNDTIHNDIKNKCWKHSRGRADYVVVCDIDEFLYLPDREKALAELKREKITVVKPTGYNMYSSNPPIFQSDNPLTTQVTQGLRDTMFDKCILFDPHAVVDINFKPGAHECHPQGKIRTCTDSNIKLLHYKNLGLQSLLKRTHLYAQRLSSDNIKNSFGIEYLKDEESIVREFNRNLQHATRVIE